MSNSKYFFAKPQTFIYVWALYENKFDYFFTLVQQPLVGQGLLVIETSRWHYRHTTLGRTPPDE